MHLFEMSRNGFVWNESCQQSLQSFRCQFRYLNTNARPERETERGREREREEKKKTPLHTKLKIKMTEVSASNLGGQNTMVPSGLKTMFSVCSVSTCHNKFE